MNQSWRQYRPAIWLAMLGVALILLISPPYIGAVLLGASIGVAIRTRQRHARAASGGKTRSRRRR